MKLLPFLALSILIPLGACATGSDNDTLQSTPARTKQADLKCKAYNRENTACADKPAEQASSSTRSAGNPFMNIYPGYGYGGYGYGMGYGGCPYGTVPATNFFGPSTFCTPWYPGYGGFGVTVRIGGHHRR